MTVEKDKYYSMPTPAYGYGWAISRTELFEAFYNQPCPDLRRFELSRMHKAADCRIYSAWTKNGYDDNNYRYVPIINRLDDTQSHSSAPKYPILGELAKTMS